MISNIYMEGHVGGVLSTLYLKQSPF